MSNLAESTYVSRQVTPPETSTTAPPLTATGIQGDNTASGSLPRSSEVPHQVSAGLDPEYPTNTNPVFPTSGSQVSVLVTGATGTAGYEILRHLCSNELKNRFKVVAGVHHDHPGLDILNDCDVIRHIDADDLSQLKFTGIDILLIVPSNSENRIEQVENYTQAAVRDGVKFILLLSLVQPLTNRSKSSIFARQFKQMESIVSECGIPCAYLRCSFFMQTLLAHAYEVATESTLSLPIGRGSCSPVNVVDASRAACAIMLDPATHAYKAYDLSGPDVLSGDDIAKAASRALGRRIMFRDCSADEFIDLYRSQGVPNWLATGFFEILDLHASGQMCSGEAKSFYQDLTGYRPIAIEQFFRDYDQLFLAPESDDNEQPLVAGKTFQRRDRRNDQGISSSRYPPQTNRRYGLENQYAGNNSEQLYQLLTELMAAKESNLHARYYQIQREEEDMNQLMRAFEMLQGPKPSRRSRHHRHRSNQGGYVNEESDPENFYHPQEFRSQRRRDSRRQYY